MDIIEKNGELARKYEDIIGKGTMTELLDRMDQLKVTNAVMMISNGVKVKDALQEVNITNGMVKKVAGRSLYYTAKRVENPKRTARSNPNKGKKLIRNGSGDVRYIDKYEYDGLVAAGRLTGKNVKKRSSSKKNHIRGGALYKEDQDEVRDKPAATYAAEFISKTLESRKRSQERANALNMS